VVNSKTEELLEGRNPVLEALKSGRPLKRIIIARGAHGGPLKEIQELVEQNKIPLEYRDKKELDYYSKTGRHQGVLAIAIALSYSTIDEILSRATAKEEAPLVLLLDGVEDPHNLGSIIRTAEVSGAHGVIVPERRSAGLNATVLRASAGAANHLPVAQVKNTARGIEELKAKGCWIIGADMDGKVIWEETFDLSLPLCLVLGGEGKGLSRLAKEHCDLLLQIPMYGKVASLNVSVAAGIFLYEVLRRRCFS
jgi:23S rRNA (guanosine2251-2'-O)-methyltransferase